jgi:hypothetical protein
MDTSVAQYGSTIAQVGTYLQPTGGSAHQKIDEGMSNKDLSDYYWNTGGNGLTRFKLNPAHIPADLISLSGITIELCHLGTTILQTPGAILRICIGAGYIDQRYGALIELDTLNEIIDQQIYVPLTPPLTRQEVVDMEIEWDWQAGGGGGRPPDPYDPPQ